MKKQKKSGFAVLVGRSNVGKSTLLNALVGSKIAIVTHKPQTTRRPIRGVLHDERGQIVFVDTPGIFLKNDPLSTHLNDLVREQLEGIEAVVYVIDPTREQGAEEAVIQKRLRGLSIPIIVVINKCDLTVEQRLFLKHAQNVDVGQRDTFEVSALTHNNLNKLVDTLFEVMPQGELFYPDHQLTDIDSKTWLADLIREKTLLRLRQEVPYSIRVEIISDEIDAKNMRRIIAQVWTTDARYKKIIIGAKASMIKQIGIDARQELESATGQKVFLSLEVGVDADWQKRALL